MLYGQPAKLVREILRRMPDDGAGAVHWERAFRDLPKNEAKALFKVLCDEEYVTFWTFGERVDKTLVCKTEKGMRLAMASARGIKRETADRMVRALLQRVEAVNADAEHCHRVSCIVLFGSYVDESKGVLGDIDVGYSDEPRYSVERDDSGESPFSRALQESRQRARHAGREFRSFIDGVMWPERQFRRALKGRVPGLHLHSLEIDARAILGGPHRVVFGAIPGSVLARCAEEGGHAASRALAQRDELVV
jgi:predicted nucleotidyltransferase